MLLNSFLHQILLRFPDILEISQSLMVQREKEQKNEDNSKNMHIVEKYKMHYENIVNYKLES